MEFGGMRCLDDFGLNPSGTHCVFMCRVIMYYLVCMLVGFGDER